MGGFWDSLGGFFGGGDSGSIWDSIGGFFEDNPEIASAGIFSAAQLASNLFGRDTDGESLDLARDKFEQDILEAEKNRELSREELTSRKELAQLAADTSLKSAQISAGASRAIARSRNLLERGNIRSENYGKAAERNIEAQKGRPELIMAGRTAQANQARATGSEGQKAFESMLASLVAGLRR